MLLFGSQALLAKLQSQRVLIDLFQKPAPQRVRNFERAPDDFLGYAIQFLLRHGYLPAIIGVHPCSSVAIIRSTPAPSEEDPMLNASLKEAVHRLLPRVKTPGQYIGGELNSVMKDHRQVRGKLCLAFPYA